MARNETTVATEASHTTAATMMRTKDSMCS
jgi:hypothetical protein